MENTQLGVPQFFLARGLKPTALTALLSSSGADGFSLWASAIKGKTGVGDGKLLGYESTKARLVRRHQALKFFKPVEDHDDLWRLMFSTFFLLCRNDCQNLPIL